jgi:hypothetical protein
MTDSSSSVASRLLGILLSKWTALLAVLLLIGGLVLQFWLPYQRLQSAIQEIEAAGAKVSVRFETVGPKWLRDLVGEEALQVLAERTRVSIRGTSQFGDAGLVHLAGIAELTELTHLFLNATQASDEGLEHLASLTDLEYVDLEFT